MKCPDMTHMNGKGLSFLQYIINQKGYDFMEHRSTPLNKTLLMPNTCINIVSGVFFQGMGQCCRGKNQKCGYLIIVMLYK